MLSCAFQVLFALYNARKRTANWNIDIHTCDMYLFSCFFVFCFFTKLTCYLDKQSFIDLPTAETRLSRDEGIIEARETF